MSNAENLLTQTIERINSGIQQAAYPEDKTVIDLFEEQVERVRIV